MPPIRHLDQDLPLLKLLHLSGSIFFVIHINGLVVKVDFETPEAEEPLDSFQIPCEEVERLSILTDADMLHKNEERLIFCFLNTTIGFLNFKTKEFNYVEQFASVSADAGNMQATVHSSGQFNTCHYLQGLNKEQFLVQTKVKTLGLYEKLDGVWHQLTLVKQSNHSGTFDPFGSVCNFLELRDHENVLKTAASSTSESEPEQSTLVAFLPYHGNRRGLSVHRIFSINSPNNEEHEF